MSDETAITPAISDRLKLLKTDLAYFSKHVLVIHDKAGRRVPLAFKRAQHHLHKALEDQRRKTGMVRAVVVKGRKVGVSTYVQARFYHRTSTSTLGLNAFVITHEQAATNVLFGMTRTFYDNHPEEFGKPPEETANAKQLRFADSGAGYTVTTAGTRETGRGGTFQLFHASEAAFWADPASTMAGAMQAVGDMPGTEVIVESTGNGIGGYFYALAMAALRNESNFQLVFIPWMWDETLEAICPDGWNPSEPWMEYAKIHRLTWEQLYWAYGKNREMALSISESAEKPCWKFMQEYPATLDEAFQGGGNSFIPSTDVMRARRPETDIIGTGAVILGVDPARTGDKIGIIDRCGRRMGERICEAWDPPGSTLIVAQNVASVIDRIKPDAVNIDVGSNGAAVYDLLKDWGYNNLTPVNFGGRPSTKGPTGDRLYANRRAELHDLMRDWLEAGEMPVQIPDRDDLHQDLTAAQWGDGQTRYNTSNALLIEEKERIKQRLGASPDLNDAAILTFATPFAQKAKAGYQPKVRRVRNRTTGY